LLADEIDFVMHNDVAFADNIKSLMKVKLSIFAKKLTIYA